MSTTIETITDEQIEALKSEARDAGDFEQVTLCDKALAGNAAARAECVRVIRAAEAMAD